MQDHEIISKAMSILGQRTSKAKTDAARKNAKLGGWPKGKKRKAAIIPNSSESTSYAKR